MKNNLNQFKKIRGLSLVELMVAMTVSAILMLGISEIFSINSRSYKVQDDNARMQENGRFGFNTLMHDLRRAGYFGGNADVTNITGTSGIIAPTNTCPNDSTWGRMLGRRIVGMNDTNAGYTCITNYSQGDIVVTRYTKGNNVSVADMTANPNRFYIRNSMFEGRLFIGSAQDVAVNTSNAVAETPNTSQELVSHAYYIGTTSRNCRFNDASNNPIPITALYRERLNSDGTPVQEEVASSIENLQIQYGVDNNDDTYVNQYFNANDIDGTPSWDQVVAVRFWILVRADCPTNGYTNPKTYTMAGTDFTPADGFKRQLYSTTITLRNGK